MSEHLNDAAMNGYARRALSPADLLAVDDHLEGCAACRAQISDEDGLKEAIRSLHAALHPATGTPSGHLVYEQLEAHAEGILGRADREIIETHLGGCELCASEARDFAAFARSARAIITAPHGPIALPAGGEKRPAETRHRSVPAPGPPRDVRAEPKPAEPPATAEEPAPEPVVPRRFSWLGLLVALAACLVAVAAAWLVPAMLRRQVGDLTAQVEALRKENEALSVQAQQAESMRAELERVRSEAAERLPAVAEATASEAAVPSMAVTLTDRRGPVGLDANGDLIGLDALPVATGRSIAAALRSGRAEIAADLQDLIAAAGPGGDEASGETARPVSPVATIVKDSRPTFSWQALPGASGYTVAVFDADFNAVARSESLTRTSWRPSRPLKRGGLYLWQAIARRRGEEVPLLAASAAAARFKVLGEAESAALERSVRDSGGSLLVAGVLLARAGCVDEARLEFRELLKKNPESPVARDLLKSLEDGREPSGPPGEPAR